MRGIIASLNTPFLDDLGLDEDSLARLVDEVVDAGCVGILSTAVAAEMSSLSLAERERVTTIVTETANGRIPIIVSVTAASLEESIELADIAKLAGAAGICCQAPAGLTRDQLHRHFATLMDERPQFLMIQDLDWHGGGLAVDDILYLFESLPPFQCLKIETVPAGPKYSRVLEVTGGRLHVSGGWAAGQMMDGLERGVHAFIPTGTLFTWNAIYRSYQQGDVDRARSLFERLLPVIAFSNQHIDISIRFLKRLRRAEGVFTTDTCRPPVPELDAIHLGEADRHIATAIALERSM